MLISLTRTLLSIFYNYGWLTVNIYLFLRDLISIKYKYKVAN